MARGRQALARGRVLFPLPLALYSLKLPQAKMGSNPQPGERLLPPLLPKGLGWAGQQGTKHPPRP